MLQGMHDHSTGTGKSEAVTDDIRVEVRSRYLAEHSDPDSGRWVFGYAVRITNESERTVKLLSRHWLITDGEGKIEEVRGPGVVGAQPVLRPGDSHEYTSFCPLSTPVGTMEGSYQMTADDRGLFDVEVGRFPLFQPNAIN
jgi:ApaG protein